MSTYSAWKYWHGLLNGRNYSKTVKEKDLGVTMNVNIKVSEQYRIAASKGNQVLRMIRRNITYIKDNSLIVPLYKAIVRPHWHMLYSCTVKPLYSQRSWDRIKCSLYRGVHPRVSPRFSYSHFLFRMLFTAPTETSN